MYKILPEGVVKYCKKHGNLTLDQTYLVRNKWNYCSQCNSERNKRFYEKRKGNWYKYPSNYVYFSKKQKLKISVGQYNEMYVKQNGLCAICKKPEMSRSTRKESIKKNKKLAIDHCHITKKIRGLLCHNCNNLLGYAKDSKMLLNEAIKYLESNE